MSADKMEASTNNLIIYPHRLHPPESSHIRTQPVLLLQGPVGPFFSSLRESFLRKGHDVLKVNFNGGDWLFTHGKGTINFVGPVESWEHWLDSFIQRTKPSVIVLFGDSRPYHAVAVGAAARANVPVWCLEEGYIRPDYVTCELNGNNARSPLRLNTARNMNEAAGSPTGPPDPITGNLFIAMALCAIVYFVAKTIGAPFFYNNVHHRNRGLLSEAVLWIRGFYRKVSCYISNHNFLEYLIEHLDKRYFVVALQVHDDQQLRRHGNGWSVDRLVTETIQSFARHADSSHHLVLKIHPMDRGHRSYNKLITEIAAFCRCSDRVHSLDDGSMGLIIRHSLGVLTVNSTSGLLALKHGKPLLVFGHALYDLPGLVTIAKDTPHDLDEFWHSRRDPDQRIFNLFTERMLRESLVNGSFYLREWSTKTSERICNRVREQTPTNVAELSFEKMPVDNNLASHIAGIF